MAKNLVNLARDIHLQPKNWANPKKIKPNNIHAKTQHNQTSEH